MEVPTPKTSPASWFYTADRELEESLPNQCLVQATKFHFGERPNLNSKSQSSRLKVPAPQFYIYTWLLFSKKVLNGCIVVSAEILLDVKGTDVGVLVCGPRKMRHEVAKICSSGLADNLHFESISFSWWCMCCTICNQWCKIYIKPSS